VCHQRIDAYGFALEGYDAIGRLREKDLGDRPIETNVKTIDGASFDGLDGLRAYLLTNRREAFVRQLVEKHVSDPKCAVCHQRIDAYGFALERYDSIGRLREKDLGDRPIETNVKTMDGASFDGLDGLRTYLLTNRREAFVRQFCRKLLGYALGRGVQLSDEPLLDEMQEELAANGYKMSVAVNRIVLSRQFREIRGMVDVGGE
jgi:hypothetical protein